MISGYGLIKFAPTIRDPMKRITTLFLTLFLAVFLVKAQSPRRTIPFDEGWKFSFGHAANPALDHHFGLVSIFAKSGKSEGTAIDPKFDDSGWRSLDLPHDWAVELPFVYSPDFDVQSHGYKPVGGLFPETSIGWYRKHFTMTPSDSGMRYSIRFDGVFRDARFWLNGFYLGRNESGYLGVTWDITDYVNFHGDNVIVVRVDATQYEGWFYEGAGIYRHVWLTLTGPVHFRENSLFVHSVPSGSEARITVEGVIDDKNLQNDWSTLPSVLRKKSLAGADPLTLTMKIVNRQGQVVSEDISEYPPVLKNGEMKVLRNLIIQDVHPWDPDDPYLYRVNLALSRGDQVLDAVSVRFGVREIRFDPDSGFFLNGRNIKLFGVNCHQDHAGVGAAVPDFLQYYRIRLLKELGINAYRASHNAPTPELLEACDSLGMLVMDEQRLLNSSPEYLDQFERLIMRDRNHPSVFLWSIGNEEGWAQTNSYGKRIAMTLLEKQQQLDPTRTSTYAADLPNHFPGINEVIPIRAFNYRQFAVADYHRDHPLQPIVGTEMGSTVTTRGIYERDTIRCYLPDQDITAPWWASTAEAWWTLCAEQPWWFGSFIWTGFDYRGEPTPFQWPNINSHFGILDMCGFRKNVSWYYESWWTERDVLHISPHWNWPGREGEAIEVWVNSNAERVSLYLNGEPLGEKVMPPRNSHLKWSVPYRPGRLEARGIRNGRPVVAMVETTGPPVKLVIVPDKMVMMPGGSDGIVCNLHAVDDAGREVPDASNLIRFSISGNCRILGAGNGDPSSHEPDICSDGQWQRKLFSGKCQIILQSGKSEGTVILKAESDGIQGTEIRLEVRNREL